MVAAVAEETQTPADLAGCLALSVIATAAGGRADRVRARPVARAGQPLHRRRPRPRQPQVRGLHADDRPLMAVEKALVELSGPARAEAETTAKLAKAAADKAAAKAANAEPGKRDQLTAEAVLLAQAGRRNEGAMQAAAHRRRRHPGEPGHPPRPNRAAASPCLSAEGGIFDIIAGRYSGTPNMEIFLKGHAGDMHPRQPAGPRRPAHRTPRRHHGTCRPARSPRIHRPIKGADGRGLLARFLYAQPESLVGQRNLTPDLIPDDVAATYAQRLGGLTMAMADWTDPAVLTLAPEADAVMLAYQRVTESRIGKGGPLHSVVKWASKRDGAVARIAGLLHLAAHLTTDGHRPIEAATLAAATELGDYFTAHAQHVFDAMSADPAQDAAHTVLHAPARHPAERLHQTRPVPGPDPRRLPRHRRPRPRPDAPGGTRLAPRPAAAQPHRTGAGRPPPATTPTPPSPGRLTKTPPPLTEMTEISDRPPDLHEHPLWGA